MRKIASGAGPAKKIFFTVLCTFFVCVFLVSCSRAAPEISYGFISLVYYEEQDRIKERFSFFIIPEDDDGVENLEELYLYHDAGQLRWHLKNVDWRTFSEDNKTWIGSWSLSMETDETLPRGQYRAVLINKGGERSERNFTFDAPAESRHPFPSIEISGGSFTVTSAYPENYLVCYDSGGTYISTVRLQMISGALSDMDIPADARMVSLWADDSELFTSAFTEAVSLH